MANFVIIAGSESGNAQMVAEIVLEELAHLGHEADLVDDGDFESADLASREIALICTSTHGLGELPDNIIPLEQRLRESSPDLSHIRYGVIALGDQTYSDTFCKAGKDMDALFHQLGARKIGDRLEIDACTQPLPDEDAVDWLKGWIALV